MRLFALLKQKKRKRYFLSTLCFSFPPTYQKKGANKGRAKKHRDQDSQARKPTIIIITKPALPIDCQRPRPRRGSSFLSAGVASGLHACWPCWPGTEANCQSREAEALRRCCWGTQKSRADRQIHRHRLNCALKQQIAGSGTCSPRYLKLADWSHW